MHCDGCDAVARVKSLGRAKTRDLATCKILFPPDDAAYLLKGANADDVDPTGAAIPVRPCNSPADSTQKMALAGQL